MLFTWIFVSHVDAATVVLAAENATRAEESVDELLAPGRTECDRAAALEAEVVLLALDECVGGRYAQSLVVVSMPTRLLGRLCHPDVCCDWRRWFRCSGSGCGCGCGCGRRDLKGVTTRGLVEKVAIEQAVDVFGVDVAEQAIERLLGLIDARQVLDETQRPLDRRQQRTVRLVLEYLAGEQRRHRRVVQVAVDELGLDLVEKLVRTPADTRTFGIVAGAASLDTIDRIVFSVI